MKKKSNKKRMHRRVFGMPERPRLRVSFSLQHIRAQVIDDLAGRTLVYCSTESDKRRASNTEMAKEMGKRVAAAALEKGIKEVVFDRADYRYHGRIRELSMAARASGLSF